MTFHKLTAMTLVFWGLQLAPTSAQIVPDTTLGPESSNVTPNIPIRGMNSDLIDGGAVRGGNLFHSFQDFNIEAQRGAYFVNPVGIENILTRVTGRNLSNIFGTLGVLGSANLFLINPNGIVFGPNARLDVGGSFLGSTADQIVFDQGMVFSATNPQPPGLLMVNVPLGLQWGINPGGIVNLSNELAVGSQGIKRPTEELAFAPDVLEILTEEVLDQLEEELNQLEEELNQSAVGLEVPKGETLALVGGDIIFNGGRLSAEQGRVEVGAVGDNSFVRFNQTDQGLALDYQGVQNFRDIQLNNFSRLDVTGDGGGDVQVQGRRILLFRQSNIDASTQGNQPGRTIEIRATESLDLFDSRIEAKVEENASGEGGDIKIETQRLSVRDGSIINTTTLGSGNSGNITIRAADIEVLGLIFEEPDEKGEVDILQSGIFADVNNQATGNGGDILIETERLTVQSNRLPTKEQDARPTAITATTRGDGNAGTLTIRATEQIQVIDSNVEAVVGREATGKGGDVTIETGRLLVADGSFISATTLGEGNAGEVTITATEIEVINRTGRRRGGILAQVNLEATGNAANLTINTERLIVRDGELISASTENIGNAGTLEINATEVELIGTGTSPNGPSASELLVGLPQPKAIGTGGDLILNTERLIVRDGAQVSGLTVGTGDGGNVIINASDIQLQNGGAITARAENQSTGGNITINSNLLRVGGNSRITANAVAGNGGNIEIAAESVLGNLSQITASSERGVDGSVDIDTDFESTSPIVELTSTVVDVESLIARDVCSPQRGQNAEVSSFVIIGRSGLPPSPTEPLGSPEVWTDVQLPRQFTNPSASEAVSPHLVEANRWIIDPNGNIELIAETPADRFERRCR